MRGLTAGVLCLLLIVAASPASAQLERGKIAGFVKDQSGAVVPGATVTAVNVETRLKRSVVSDATGYYVFPALAPGAYDVEVELEGFKKGVQTGVRLDASANMSVDFTLETGAISESVTVTAEATPLQTDATIRKTVEAKDLELLSFSGRNPIGVVSLKAGVMGGAFNSRGFADLGNGGFNINGSRADENTIYIDGAVGVRTRFDRHHHRHPERRCRAGSAGPDGELHARIRPRERRADPLRDQERQQPVHGERVVLLSR